MVKKTLGYNRKIECDQCTKTGGFKSSSDFANAFRDYAKGNSNAKNVKLCYDMPFRQVRSGFAAGSFEFDSDLMLNNTNKTVGGFFPELLNNSSLGEATVVNGSADYSDCPNCRTKYKAESFVGLTKKINPWCFERGYETKAGFNAWTGSCNTSISACCGNPYGEVSGGPASTEGTYKDMAFGHFAHGSWPLETWGYTPNNCNPNNDANCGMIGEWNATWRDTTLHLWGDSGCGKAGDGEKNTCKANEFFCFESHAEFTYDPAQEFFIRGDDDIWVFINNQLVIDLGGSHLAAPGAVKLDTLELRDGERYPIDIFFCNRRSTMSNIRISTNMYVSQRSSFYDNPGSKDNAMCAIDADCASKMGMDYTEYCGKELIDRGYAVDFYMIRRGARDTIWLSPAKNPDCYGNANNFTCYGGIKVTDGAVYSCGGARACQGNYDAINKVRMIGNFNVYARLKNGGYQVGKPIPIDRFKSELHTNIVWGTLIGENSGTVSVLLDADGRTTTGTQTVIAGKRTPIYISEGSWSDPGTYTTFEYLNKYPDGSPSDAYGHPYSITVSGNTGLKLYAKSTGTDTKLSGAIPASGVDTVWVEGDYSGEKEFEINVTTPSAEAPSLKLKVYMPEFRFMNNTFTSPVTPIGFSRWATADGKPPFVGYPLDIYIALWDPRRNEICTDCYFPIRDESSTNNPDIIGYRIVNSTGLNQIENGKITARIFGMEDTGWDGYTVTWRIYGPPGSGIEAQWTGLQFRDTPIPMPVTSYIYDRNGDGIGDSLRVIYNRSLFSKGDSALPILLEVLWEKENPVYFHNPNYKTEDLKNVDYVRMLYQDPAFFAENRNYWQQFIQDTVIVIANSDITFSKKIQTAPVDVGNGMNSNLSSYAPFIDKGLCTVNACGKNAFQYTSLRTSITDRMPPIVVSAKYTYDTNNSSNCLSNANGCREKLDVILSEPVVKIEGTPKDLIKNPFSYCFGYSQNSDCPTTDIKNNERYSQSWDNLYWGWELPAEKNARDTAYSASYGSDSKGDSIVNMVYYSRKVNNQTTRMPKIGDWVKIRHENSVFLDIAGNMANPRERGVLIAGTSPTEPPKDNVCQTYSLRILNGEICLIGDDCEGVSICGRDLAPRISYIMEIPGFGELNLSANSNCSWNSSKTIGTCYSGIYIDNGTVTITEGSMPSGIRQLGFKLYAVLDEVQRLEIPRGGTTPITNSFLLATSHSPTYYSLKGEPLGGKKPSKAGVYLMRQGSASKMIAVLEGN